MNNKFYRALAPALFLLVLLAGIATAGAAVITVCPSGCNETSIQSAINNATAGDTIIVMPGSYHETIAVNKSLSLTGVADGDRYPHVGQYQAPVAITISAPDVVLDGFDPYGAGEHAIEITGDNVTVRNIIASIHRPEHGIDAIISVQGVTGIAIRDCMLESSGQVGINLSDCQGVRITGNDILVNSSPDPMDWEQPRAIHVEFQTPGTYADYLVDNNTVTGGPVLIPLGSFYVDEVHYSDIRNISVTGNRVQDSPYGGLEIYGYPDYSGPEPVFYQSGFNISDNMVTRCGGYGIDVSGIKDGLIARNTLKDCTDIYDGLAFESLNNFVIRDNTITNSSGDAYMTGLALYDIHNSTISGNTVDGNAYNLYFYTDVPNPGLVFDTTNLINGKPVRYYENKDNFAVDGDELPGATYIFVDCHNVSLSRLSVSGMYFGVSFLYCDNIRMTHSDISRCYNAINVFRCSDSLLYTNMLEDNVFGISTYAFNSSEIWRNDIYNSTRAGVYVRATGDGLKVSNNQIRDGYAGIRVSGNYIDEGGEPLVLDGNGFSNNMYGIMFSRVQNVHATGNVIENSTNMGLALAAIEDCRFENNTIQYNNWGIQLINYGDYSGLNGNNTFCNNYFNNYQQVMVLSEELPMGDFEKVDIKVPHGREHIKETEISVDEEQSGTTNLQNYWNITKSSGTNIAGGPYLGGNYWASPDGTGFSQTHEDRGDGFCDEPYVFDQWNTDYLPLHTYTPKPAFYADFSVSPASGSAPLTVHCTDNSGGSPTRYVYNFGDGTTATGPNPSHTYRYPGTYTVTLSVTKYNTTTHSMMMANKTRAGAVTVETLPFVPPVADFTASPTGGSAPLSVQFTDLSTGSPVMYSYDFGDGSNITGANPVHDYRYPGIYNVTLTVLKNDPMTGGVVDNSSVRTSLIVVTG